jgi:hypothetical protein
VYEAKLQGLAATINAQAPDALSLQEIGDPAALNDLEALLDATWHRHVSEHPDQRHIRVAWLTPDAISNAEDILAFPDHLEPVQVDDDGATLAVMGRGAVAITVQSSAGHPVTLLTTEVEAADLPGGRFQPHDEAERARAGSPRPSRFAQCGSFTGPARGVPTDTSDTSDLAHTQGTLIVPRCFMGRAVIEPATSGSRVEVIISRALGAADQMPLLSRFVRAGLGVLAWTC